MGKKERLIDELYADDPERADALVFGRRTGLSRRGFLGGAGLAAMGAAVGGPIVFAASMPGGLIPAALAQEAKKDARRRAPARPAEARVPRQGHRARRARRQAAGGRDAGAAARRRHDADGEVLHPQQRPDRPSRPAIRTPGSSPSTARSASPSRSPWASSRSASSPRPSAWCWSAAATAARSSRRRRGATSGPTAASAAPNGPACRSAMCCRAAGLKATAVYTANYGTDAHLSGDPKP